MSTIRYTVIIPVPVYRADWPALNSLVENPPPRATQILLAVGRHPSQQRNAALQLSQGEIIVFLDSDSVPEPNFWDRLDLAFQQKEVQIVGGPALLREGSGTWEQINHTLLSHGFIVGPISSRYSSHGDFRASSQAELILCNMAVRREVFEKVGLFSPHLFPNEENEWMDRAQASGIGIFHDPTLLIRRPERENFQSFFGMLLRNGIGRTQQFLLTRKLEVPQILLGAALMGLLIFIFLTRTYCLFFGGMLWVLASFLIYFGAPFNTPFNVRFMSSLLGPLVPLTYITGQIIGFFQKGPGITDAPITVTNELGEVIG